MCARVTCILPRSVQKRWFHLFNFWGNHQEDYSARSDQANCWDHLKGRWTNMKKFIKELFWPQAARLPIWRPCWLLEEAGKKHAEHLIKWARGTHRSLKNQVTKTGDQKVQPNNLALSKEKRFPSGNWSFQKTLQQEITDSQFQAETSDCSKLKEQIAKSRAEYLKHQTTSKVKSYYVKHYFFLLLKNKKHVTVNSRNFVWNYAWRPFFSKYGILYS